MELPVARSRKQAGHASLTLVLLLLAGGARARPMQVLQTTPAENATIDSLNIEFAVRFDGDVDHREARLYVTHEEKVVEELHPLLSAAAGGVVRTQPTVTGSEL